MSGVGFEQSGVASALSPGAPAPLIDKYEARDSRIPPAAMTSSARFISVLHPLNTIAINMQATAAERPNCV
jgi:hypothetical protein